MEKILKDLPAQMFQVPEGVVFAKVDSKTGLLPISESSQTRFECFKEGTAPTQYTKRSDMIVDSDTFFKSDM
jgi:penicillin-binding protein 1A